jgi:hypothetical protein
MGKDQRETRVRFPGGILHTSGYDRKADSPFRVSLVR